MGREFRGVNWSSRGAWLLALLSAQTAMADWNIPGQWVPAVRQSAQGLVDSSFQGFQWAQRYGVGSPSEQRGIEILESLTQSTREFDRQVDSSYINAHEVDEQLQRVQRDVSQLQYQLPSMRVYTAQRGIFDQILMNFQQLQNLRNQGCYPSPPQPPFQPPAQGQVSVLARQLTFAVQNLDARVNSVPFNNLMARQNLIQSVQNLGFETERLNQMVNSGNPTGYLLQEVSTLRRISQLARNCMQMGGGWAFDALDSYDRILNAISANLGGGYQNGPSYPAPSYPAPGYPGQGGPWRDDHRHGGWGGHGGH